AWAYRPGVTECLLTGTVTCPEGKFPITASLKGVEGVAGSEGGSATRQWMIERPRVSGFIDESRATRTPYGWLVPVLELHGTLFGALYVKESAIGGTSSHVYTYLAFVAEPGDLRWIEVARDPLLQLAFAAPTAIAHPDEYKNYTEQHFLKLRAP